MYKKAKYPNNFGGLEKQTFDQAKAIVLPVPYEGTVSYGGGTGAGPQAIINASSQVELYDIELDAEPYKFGIYTLPALNAVKKLSPEKMVEVVGKKYSELVAQNKFVVMIGGEHSVTCAVAPALHKKYPKLSVLQWDAHADLRDSYEGTKFSHACAMRRFYDLNIPVTQVGIRSMSKEEADFIKKSKIQKNIFTPENFNVQKILKNLTDDVYITIDIDGFDPAFVPATGTPEPGGLTWSNFIELMRAVFSQKNVVGFDMVESAPIKGHPASDFLAAKAIYKLLGYKLIK